MLCTQATEDADIRADHGYDVMAAFGGDGTLNEVANGLAGTDVPVSVLPGGSRSGYEPAQAIWGNVAVIQVFLTLIRGDRPR